MRPYISKLFNQLKHFFSSLTSSRQRSVPAHSITAVEYMALFEGEGSGEKSKLEEAFRQAIDARKFEIEMYWKRATYFWTFIAAAFVGYTAFINATPHRHGFAALLMSEVGFIFSYAWFMVNRGSKAWQENWENHVQLLEDKIAGPIYKVTTTRPKGKSNGEPLLEQLLTSPRMYSVSKINSIVSFHVVLIWAALTIVAVASLWIDDGGSSIRTLITEHLNIFRWLVISIIVISTVLTVIVLHTQGSTHMGGHNPVVTLRSTNIQDK